jgi:hypothetical protein
MRPNATQKFGPASTLLIHIRLMKLDCLMETMDCLAVTPFYTLSMTVLSSIAGLPPVRGRVIDDPTVVPAVVYITPRARHHRGLNYLTSGTSGLTLGHGAPRREDGHFLNV